MKYQTFKKIIKWLNKNRKTKKKKNEIKKIQNKNFVKKT